jgi:phage shock protein PspC (stress-responsive transcriptional regulator)
MNVAFNRHSTEEFDHRAEGALYLRTMTTLTHLLFAIAGVLAGLASVLRQGLGIVRLFKKKSDAAQPAWNS